MNATRIIELTENFAQGKMKDYDGGHDWWHVERVRNLARYINSREKMADPFILDMAAILHDVADSKFISENDYNRYQEISDFLSAFGMDAVKEELLSIIRNVSFSNKNPSGDLLNPILLILQDADKLDAIGAIGIARAFNYGGFRNNPIYIPEEPNGGQGKSTIGHFYDKLLKLSGMMNTETARWMAVERHEVLLEFLNQFYHEWNTGMEPDKS
jgi:uncharacterized protein